MALRAGLSFSITGLRLLLPVSDTCNLRHPVVVGSAEGGGAAGVYGCLCNVHESFQLERDEIKAGSWNMFLVMRCEL